MNWLTLLTNIGKIKGYVSAAVLIISKLRTVLEFVKKELTGTAVGEKLGKQLPAILDALDKVLELISNISKVFGASPDVSALSVHAASLDDAMKQLDNAVVAAKEV